MLFDLDFANNAISSFFFSFFLVIDFYFFIPTAIAQTFNPIGELLIPIGIPIKEAKAEIEIHAVLVETKIRKFQYTFLCFLLISSFYFFREIISFFIYNIQSRFWTHVFRVIIHFQSNQ